MVWFEILQTWSLCNSQKEVVLQHHPCGHVALFSSCVSLQNEDGTALKRVCGLSWATELWFLGRHCGSIMLKRNPTPLQPLSLKTQRLTSVKSRLIKSSTGERKDTYDFVVNCPFKLSILLNTDRISSKGERGFYSQQPIRKYSSVVQPSFRSVIKSISDTNKHTHTPTRPVCFTTNWRLCSNVTHIKGD